ncbi:MAG: carboxylating nicotinate-nucleotide diphosphorylase [Clostridiales bacterium]|nr:carboxylating nicotinate-nucleotide diphosphorylase [Clostridiales bacterium]
MKQNEDKLILQALREDISNEDITTNAIVDGNCIGKVDLICKQDGILAGLEVFKRVFELLDENAELESKFKDGDSVKEGDLVAVVHAKVRALLSGERTALNFLQRMSGIATHTRDLVKELEGTNTKLLDTRKTTPNMRIFEKYAIRVGGGHNHRFNLSDGILIKDNHINAAGSIKKAVELARNYAPFGMKIEVEVENLDMVKEALEAKADIIMLDNMDYETMKKAVEIIGGRAVTECSGNVTKDKLSKIAKIGVDFVSSGALTHSSLTLDFSMKNLEIIGEK